MELSFDWQGLQGVFNPGRRSFPLVMGLGDYAAIHLVVERGKILSVYSDGEDLSEWIGATYEELSVERPNRELILFERKELEECLIGSFKMLHFYDQLEYLRQNLKPLGFSHTKTVQQLRQLEVRKHFFFEIIEGWWSKVLPSAYGVFIRIEGQGGGDFFLVVRRGRIEQCHEPDLTPMGPERMLQSTDVVKYLSQKYLVPVQGVFVNSSEWHDWSESPTPWKKVAASLRSRKTRLVPFRSGLMTLIATRSFLGF